MHSNARRVDEAEAFCRIEIAVHAGLEIGATAPLALPVFAEGIPLEITSDGSMAVSAALSLSLLQAGLLRGEDYRDGFESEHDLVNSAIGRFFMDESEGVKHFDLRTIYYDENPGFAPDDDGLTEMSGIDEAVPVAYFLRVANAASTVFVKGGIERLEAACPGLGETAMFHLNHSVWAVANCATPAAALEWCEYLYWEGEEDESDVLEAYGEDGVHFTRAEFTGTVPEIAYKPRKALNQPALAKLRKSDNALVREVADVLSKLGAASRKSCDLPNVCNRLNMECYDYSLVIRWSDDDPIGRILDDRDQWMSGDEYTTDVMGMSAFNATKENIAGWFEYMRLELLRMRLLDRLICLVAGTTELPETA